MLLCLSVPASRRFVPIECRARRERRLVHDRHSEHREAFDEATARNLQISKYNFLTKRKRCLLISIQRLATLVGVSRDRYFPSVQPL